MLSRCKQELIKSSNVDVVCVCNANAYHASHAILALQNDKYVRVRDIIGQNSQFVDQSGTYPKKFTDFKPEDSERDDDEG